MKRRALVCLSATAVTFLAVTLPTRAQTNVPGVPAGVAAKPAEPTFRVMESANSSEPVVSMAFDETPLTDVIKAFRDATGANIISGGTNLQGTVSVRLDNVPWRKGLASILEPQNLQLLEQPTGSGIYVVTAKTVEIPKLTRSFDLKHARSEDVTNLIARAFGPGCNASAYTAANVVIVTATEQQIAECEKIITAIDKQTPQVYIEVRFAELSASASKKLGMKWDSLGTKEGWGVSFDGASLGYTDASGETTVKGKKSSSGITSKDTRTLGASEANSLSVSNADGPLETITTATSADSVSSALESIASGSSSRSYDKTHTDTRDRIFTGSLSMDAFTLAINAFEQVDGVSIFSNPKIIVSNEKEAIVDMTTKEPNLTVTTTRSGQNSDQIDIAARLEVIPGERGDRDGKGRGLFAGEAFFSYGISLKVTPRISPTGLITLVAEPSISALKNYYEFTGMDGSTPTPRYPIIDMQRMQTVFTMQSGTTAVIGGLTKTTEGNIDSGIPWLRELPWIGPRIFGWKSRGKEQKEIIIFVTVGLADPVQLPENVGMPKNAILGRDLLTGALKEPGDRTKEEVLSIEDPKRPVKAINKPETKASGMPTPQEEVTAAAPLSEREAAKAAQPEVVEPLLQNK